jgi:death on curing protein
VLSSPHVEEVTIEDVLLIGEATLGPVAEDLARVINVPLIESALAAPFATFGGIDFYPEFHVKAAVLCSRIARNHSLPDGNKRVAYLSMLLFIESNGHTWTVGDQDEVADAVEALVARELSEDEFAAWAGRRID